MQFDSGIAWPIALKQLLKFAVHDDKGKNIVRLYELCSDIQVHNIS